MRRKAAPAARSRGAEPAETLSPRHQASRAQRLCRCLRRLSFVVAAALVVHGRIAAVAEEPAGTAASREALALCHRAQDVPPDQQEELLSDSLARADAAIAADGNDALAHFARFCALGEQARRSGASLSSLVRLWSIRDAVDRTLELAPDFPDALLGKGAFLCSVPRLLGGDCAEGERLVRRALEIDPDYVGARLFLAETLLEDGRTTDARLEAERALASAERKRDAAAVDDARRVLSSIDG